MQKRYIWKKITNEVKIPIKQIYLSDLALEILNFSVAEDTNGSIRAIAVVKPIINKSKKNAKPISHPHFTIVLNAVGIKTKSKLKQSTKLVGTFGGAATNAACNRYCFGYIQGINDAAKELGKTVDVTVSFLYGGGFSSSPELQTQISGWYNNGTQVVFSCGGSMLQSVKAAAEETTDGKIIGVDVDQSGESERVITSACKGLRASVKQTLEVWDAGNWDTELADKTTTKSAANQGTEIPTADGSWRFNSFTVDEYKAIFDKVVSGEIKINNDCADLQNFKSNASWKTLVDYCKNVNLTVEE